MVRNSKPTLQFLGAAGTVTGSRYLIEADDRRILVDCGLFQGYKQLRERNRAEFPVPPDSIDTLLLTHAHLDHSGYIPALVRNGFRGQVHCTPATRDLCALLLRDSGHLLEEDAKYARKKGYSRHADPAPLYTVADAEAALERFVVHDFGTTVALGKGCAASFLPAGHLLGAAQIALDMQGFIVHFSGDLGRGHDPLMRPPQALKQADVLVCESTYGNRRHADVDPEAELAPVVRRVAARGGVILIPAFAVGRSQGVMLHLARLRERGEIPAVPVFLNSPMAIKATDLYHRYHAEHHVTAAECEAMYELATMVRTADESRALNQRNGPMIILSASGMLSGGRVLHHLAAFAPEHRNAIVLSGFQAGGTRGAALVGGADHLRIFGNEVPIRAEVVTLDSFSGHADADEILGWMDGAGREPTITYVTHGEADASDALRRRIKRELGWRVRVPEHLERVELGAKS
ncbi:MAG: MBL fold metallo-hydrolase RNA specificity domain-containing protein [Steroidobacteraceae bacterium]